MTTTFHLPSGVKVRSASQCRFVLIREEGGKAVVIKRSAKVEVLAKERSRRGFHSGVQFFVGDTASAQIVTFAALGVRA
jgi:hypothetical protein